MPFMTGSTTVMVAAVAIAASNCIASGFLEHQGQHSPPVAAMCRPYHGLHQWNGHFQSAENFPVDSCLPRHNYFTSISTDSSACLIPATKHQLWAKPAKAVCLSRSGCIIRQNQTSDSITSRVFSTRISPWSGPRSVVAGFDE